MFGYLFEEIEFTANAESLFAKERGGGTEKFVEKRLTLDKNLLSTKYFSQNALSSNYYKPNRIK